MTQEEIIKEIQQLWPFKAFAIFTLSLCIVLLVRVIKYEIKVDKLEKKIEQLTDSK